MSIADADDGWSELDARRVNRLPGATTTATNSFNTHVCHPTILLFSLHWLIPSLYLTRIQDSTTWLTDTPSRSPLSRPGKHSAPRVITSGLLANSL